MSELELRVIGSIISIGGSVLAIIFGIWRILKIFKDGILKEINTSSAATIITIEKETLKNEIAINKAVQPVITRVDHIEEKLKDHDKKINRIEQIQQENLAIAIEYKTKNK